MNCTLLGVEDLTKHRKQFVKALAAEFLGVFFLVLVGCGSCLNWDGAPPLQVSIVQIALAFGVTVATLVQCIGHVSGGHINPAVTCAMLVTNKIRVIRAVTYTVAQCLGGITGAAVLKAVTPSGPHTVELGLSKVNDKISTPEGFGVEFLITFVLIFTVFGVCDGNRNDVKGSAPLAIGLAVATCHLFAVSTPYLLVVFSFYSYDFCRVCLAQRASNPQEQYVCAPPILAVSTFYWEPRERSIDVICAAALF